MPSRPVRQCLRAGAAGENTGGYTGANLNPISTVSRRRSARGEGELLDAEG